MNTNSEKDDLSIAHFDYPLPDERIAKHPLSPRDSSKLLLFENGKISQSRFSSLTDFLPPQSLLVYNNTKVIRARIEFYKETGARVEIFCLEPEEPSDYALALSASGSCTWKCLVGNLKKWKGDILFKDLQTKEGVCRLEAELLYSDKVGHSIRFTWDNENLLLADILELAGELPIPPYLNRKTEARDYEDYQTVYSKIAGSVAAPTAGLHFTAELMGALAKKGIEREELTLHVGAGTFRPVKSEYISEHQMHTELVEVSRKALEKFIQHKGTLVAVGTTSVRSLESLYHIGVALASGKCQDALTVTQWAPYETQLPEMSTQEALQHILDYLEREKMDKLHAATQIMIRPGYRFRLVDAVITNFHQPKSTLLLLVSAFVGDAWKEIYEYALANDFRFLSYGDSSLLFRAKSPEGL